jgi:hypothetical protein
LESAELSLRIFTNKSHVDEVETLHYYLAEVEVLVTQIEKELQEVVGCGQVRFEVKFDEHDSFHFQNHFLRVVVVALVHPLVYRQESVFVNLDGHQNGCDADELEGAGFDLVAPGHEQLHESNGLHDGLVLEVVLLAGLAG